MEIIPNHVKLSFVYRVRYFFVRIFKKKLDAEKSARELAGKEINNIIEKRTEKLVQKICSNC